MLASLVVSKRFTKSGRGKMLLVLLSVSWKSLFFSTKNDFCIHKAHLSQRYVRNT